MPDAIATTLQAILLIAGTALSQAGELLPVPDRWKDGAYVAGATGIDGANQSTDYIAFEVGAGSYAFRLTGQ